MLPVTPKELVQKIVDEGFSQTDISLGTGISQPTISRILSGAHKDPKNSVVEKLRSFASKNLSEAA